MIGRVLGRPSVSLSLVAGLTLALGCARGGAGEPDSGRNRPGPGASDAGRDAGRDSGRPLVCDEVGYASSCPSATELEPLMPGDRLESEVHVIRRGANQWVRIDFPIASPEVPDGGTPTMAGTGQPRVRFARNDDDVYRVEVRTSCVAVASCGEGGTEGRATSLTEWSFADEPAMSLEGPGQFSTRDVPWPTRLYVRIYPRVDPGCAAYQLEISR